MEMFVLLFQKTFVYAIPLIIVALGGMFAERSGVINLALEGEMIIGAFVAAICVYAFQNSGNPIADHPQAMFVVALLIAGIAGAVFSLLLSFSAINLKADQTIGGTALNMLAPAIVCTLGLAFFNQEKIVMPSSTGYPILNPDYSWVGRLFADKMYISTYIIIGIFIILSIWVFTSKIGLRMRACGEHPQAAASVGINVFAMRYLGTTISGFLAGIGGYAYIATTSAGTAQSSIAGMGFLALAIMIFGNWKPLWIALGGVLFGFLNCLGALSSQIDVLKNAGLPFYFYNMLPYIVILIVLAVTAKKSGCPKAEGIPYEKGMR